MRSVRESLRRESFGKKGRERRLLLAPCPRNEKEFFKKVREVPSIHSNIALPVREVDLHNVPLAICAMGS